VEQYKLDTFSLEVAIILVQVYKVPLSPDWYQSKTVTTEKMNHLSDFSNFLGHTNQHWECRLHVCTSCGDSTATLELWNCSSYISVLWSICVLKCGFYSYHSNMAE